MATSSATGMALRLVCPGTIIPGVPDNSSIELWYRKQNPDGVFAACIKKSTTGGIGLYGIGRDLMTVLKMQTYYDYETLMQGMEKMCELNRNIIKTVIRTLAPTTEIAVLQCYMVGFKICQLSGNVNDETLVQYIPYLGILCNTDVVGLVSMGQEQVEGDRFLQVMQHRYNREQADYIRLVEAVKTVEGCGEVVLDIDTFRQLNGAVRSRVMEIPHLESEEGEEVEEVKTEQENEGEIVYREEDADALDADKALTSDVISRDIAQETTTTKKADFVTNVTLVPYVDFANHASKEEANAFFDYESNSVVLKLDRDLDVETEITICYAPVEHIQIMIAEFGFVPRLTEKSLQILEDVIPLEYIQSYLCKFHGLEYEYLLMCKWLGVFPRLKICIHNEEVYLVEVPYELLVLFSENLRYNPNWRELIIASCSDMAHEEQQEVIEDLEQQLEYCDYVEANMEGVQIKKVVLEEVDQGDINKAEQVEKVGNNEEETENEYIQCNGERLQELFLSQLQQLESHLVKMIRSYLLDCSTEAVQYSLKSSHLLETTVAKEKLTTEYLLIKSRAFSRLAQRLELDVDEAMTPPPGYSEQHEQLRVLWPKTSSF